MLQEIVRNWYNRNEERYSSCSFVTRGRFNRHRGRCSKINLHLRYIYIYLASICVKFSIELWKRGVANSTRRMNDERKDGGGGGKESGLEPTQNGNRISMNEHRGRCKWKRACTDVVTCAGWHNNRNVASILNACGSVARISTRSDRTWHPRDSDRWRRSSGFERSYSCECNSPRDVLRVDYERNRAWRSRINAGTRFCAP